MTCPPHQYPPLKQMATCASMRHKSASTISEGSQPASYGKSLVKAASSQVMAMYVVWGPRGFWIRIGVPLSNNPFPKKGNPNFPNRQPKATINHYIVDFRDFQKKSKTSHLGPKLKLDIRTLSIDGVILNQALRKKMCQSNWVNHKKQSAFVFW